MKKSSVFYIHEAFEENLDDIMAHRVGYEMISVCRLDLLQLGNQAHEYAFNRTNISFDLDLELR